VSIAKALPRACALAIAALLLSGTAYAAEPVLGHWETQNHKAVVEIAPCGRLICGHIVKLLPAADAGIYNDIHNSDPVQRKRPLLGLPILLDYADSGKEWSGHIYDPQYGNTYTSTMSRNPDGTLKIRGCLFIICKTQTWRPVRD
jgi:uncharacterized protein (DUF2147 family)